ncbi:MAG: radical SAM protein [Candidatus Xenobiia bacterium LiM19]
MITTFSSESGNRYLYDSITGRIIDYDGESGSEMETFNPRFVKDLAEFDINPYAKADILTTINANDIHGDLKNRWKSLNLCITEECTNRCLYCIHSYTHIHKRSSRNRHMPWETVKKAIDMYLEHSRDMDARWITFYGGEPLLNWDVIVRAVEYLQDKASHVRVHISTNGVLLDRKKIEYLISNSISVNISLDGPEDVHDLYRVTSDGCATWFRIISALNEIKRLNPEYYGSHVRLLCTIAPPYDLLRIGEFFNTHPHLKEILFNVRQVDQNDIFITRMDPEMRSLGDRVKRLFEEALKKRYINAGQLGKASEHFGGFLYENVLRSIHNRVMNPGPSSKLPGSCFPGEHQIYVSLDGTLYPCQRCGGCSFMPMGTLNDGLDTDLTLKYIEDSLETCRQKCTSCWCCHLCSQCHISGKKGEKYDEERKEQACRATRKYISECLEIYTSILEARPDGLDFLSRSGRSREVHALSSVKCRIS